MFVLTVDQRSSRQGDDAVPALLEMLNREFGEMLVLPFERTAGDEVQGLLAEPGDVATVLIAVLRREQWSIGIGVGDIDEPRPESVRAGRGDAYVYARDAVDRAKSAPYPVCVAAHASQEAERAETACWLLAGIVLARSQAGWQAVDAMKSNRWQKSAATQLGITPQAMSRRLQVAGFVEEQRGTALVEYLLKASEARS